ncbi:MAG: hypothetical protein Q9209_005636 [Squamulea sp. 1 TL-2023]
MEDVILSPLDCVDGSATYSSNGYSVIAAVNGPVEVQRRDEIPEEAAIDVVLRPAAGGYAKGILNLLSRRQFDKSYLFQRIHNLPLLPALLQSSILGLLSTSLPLTMTLTSTLVAVSRSGELVTGPSVKALKEATSLHVLAFSSHGELLVAKSEGTFDMDIWDQVYSRAENLCRGSKTGDMAQTDDVDMEPSESDSLEDSLRGIIGKKAVKDLRWKEG